jgi:hypothetical protein
LNVALVSIVIVLAFLLYKTIAGRRSSPPKETSTEKKKSSKGRSDSSSRRSRSKSTSSRRSSRSKSRSRKTDDSYKLMEDEDDKSKRSSRSVRSSRSRSRSVKRSRSRGSARSKSRTRSKSKKLDESKSREIKEVLVWFPKYLSLQPTGEISWQQSLWKFLFSLSLIIVVRPVHKVVCAALGYIYTHCKTIDPSLDSTMQNACRLLIASFHFIAAMWLMPV